MDWTGVKRILFVCFQCKWSFVWLSISRTFSKKKSHKFHHFQPSQSKQVVTYSCCLNELIQDANLRSDMMFSFWATAALLALLTLSPAVSPHSVVFCDSAFTRYQYLVCHSPDSRLTSKHGLTLIMFANTEDGQLSAGHSETSFL